KPNRYLIFLLPVFLLLGFLFHLIKHEAFFPALLHGLGVMVILFLTWAINREIDPDYDYSAFLAVGVALFPAFLWENTGFLILFWILPVLRIINKSTGLHSKISDSIFIVLFSGALAWSIDPAFILFAGMAFLADAFLPLKNKTQIYFAGASFILFFLIFMLTERTNDPYLYHSLTLPVLIGCSVLFIPVIFLTRNIKTQGDYSEMLLEASRLRFAGWFVLFLATYITLFHGINGLVMMLPVWASIAATSIYRYIVLMSR
ncbi:MAG: hypothetical protein ACOC10_02420, partial [Bacteroidota bacterium]